MFERFTAPARGVVVQAQEESRALGHPFIGTEHLLLGLLTDEAGVGGTVLRSHGLTAAEIRESVQKAVGQCASPPLDADALGSIGIDLDQVRRKAEKAFGPGALSRGRSRKGKGSAGHIPFTARAKKTLELSLREAVHRRDGFIGTEHLLLALLREGEGLAALLLGERHLDRATAERAVERLRRTGEADTG